MASTPHLVQMASSKKKQSEGIALLSMYGDDEEEDEDMEDNNDDDVVLEEHTTYQTTQLTVSNMEEDELETTINTTTSYSVVDSVVYLDSGKGNDGINDNDSKSTTAFGVDDLKTSDQQGGGRGRKGSLGIVDYGHDEAALSPEAEEGEISAAGRVMFGAELQTVNGTPSGTITPNIQSTPPQTSDQSQSDALLNYKGNETECAEAEKAVNITNDDGDKEMDPLDKFLPPPPTTKCSNELQEKITKFLQLKKNSGRSFNSEVRNRKEYRNPDFLLHAVTYQDIDQIGSCFSKDVFDPHGYDKADYYDEIEADLKREVERREQEKKKNQKIDFLSGGTQSAVAMPTPKVTPTAVPIAGGGSNPVSAGVGTGTREGRPNKKSKWDKVDGDRRQDPISSVGSGYLSAGTGYTAFAQHRRREAAAEERRSSDRK